MSQRTTIDAVKKVLLAGSDGGAYNDVVEFDLQPFIDTATAVVDRVLQCVARKGGSMSDAEKELMERWLAAHFYAMTDQTYAEKVTDKSEGKFHGQTGMYLEATKYGQTAGGVLDPYGCLTALDKKRRASGSWLGKPENEQINYDDRN